jgi:hypothetical protein
MDDTLSTRMATASIGNEEDMTELLAAGSEQKPDSGDDARQTPPNMYTPASSCVMCLSHAQLYCADCEEHLCVSCSDKLHKIRL